MSHTILDRPTDERRIETGETGRTLSVAALTQRLEQGEAVQIIDVRSPGEYAAGHIPGAVNIPMEQVEARQGDLRPDLPVALICQSGRRAGIACTLLEHERPDAIVLEGGTSAWQAAGLPVVRTTASRWSLERQVRLGAGLLILAGVILSLTVHPYWVFLSLLVGAGFTFAGLTDICGMGIVLTHMPWNRTRR
jgi:rhodanese-related sulfurtransferase